MHEDDLGQALDLFTEKLRIWDLDPPSGPMGFGRAGEVSSSPWHVRFVVRMDDRGPFIEYLASNKFAWGDVRERIYADGEVVSDLPTLEPVVVILPGEDEDEARRRYSERNRAIADDLRQAGIH